MPEQQAEVRQQKGASGVDTDSTFTNYQAITSKTFVVSLLVEFVGMVIFSFLGSTVSDKVFVPWVNGLALAIMIYTAANISGGHINPAVTFSTLICGFYPLLHSVLYVILQFVGAIVGSLLAAALLPEASIGMGNGGPGCFDTTTISPLITRGQLFGWEVVMTFTLISVVYACGVAKPGHASFTPLVVGLSLVACAGTGGRFTGAALNPARVVGPLAVFHCGNDIAWIYVLAQLLAACLACSIFAFVSGWGPLSPFTSMNKLRLSYHEAVLLWMTGQPPKRYRKDGTENINDVLYDVIGSVSMKAAQAGSRVFGMPSSVAKVLGLGAKGNGSAAGHPSKAEAAAQRAVHAADAAEEPAAEMGNGALADAMEAAEAGRV